MFSSVSPSCEDGLTLRVNPPKPSPKPGDLPKGLGREAGGARGEQTGVDREREREKKNNEQRIGHANTDKHICRNRNVGGNGSI